MLTQGPAPDPNCELYITSFLTLAHSFHLLICTSDIMIVVLLFQRMGGAGWKEGGSFMLGFGWGDRRWVSYFLFFFYFCTVVYYSFMAGT